MEKEIETYYQTEAKQFVDSMFDAKVFSPEMTRDSIQAYEDILAFYMQSHAASAKKIAEFRAKWNFSTNSPN